MREINTKHYPQGWFKVQLLYADRWAEITGESVAAARERRTSLITALGQTANLATASADELYGQYLALPHTDYAPSHRFGAFDYAYLSESTVKLHFENPQRGTNPLSAAAFTARRSDLKNLFIDVKDNHPDAQWVDSCSWVRSLPNYQALFPPDLDPPENCMRPDMRYGEYYVWSQFIDRYGQTNERIAGAFLDNVARAQTTEALVAAFPLPALRVHDPIKKYYQDLGL
jgi:hypothetical protein